MARIHSHPAILRLTMVLVLVQASREIRAGTIKVMVRAVHVRRCKMVVANRVVTNKATVHEVHVLRCRMAVVIRVATNKAMDRVALDSR